MINFDEIFLKFGKFGNKFAEQYKGYKKTRYFLLNNCL
jgi:hypothetical protein